MIHRWNELPKARQSLSNLLPNWLKVWSLKTKVSSQLLSWERQKRAQLETTIVKSAEMINDSVKLRDEKIVQALLDQGKAAQKEVQE